MKNRYAVVILILSMMSSLFVYADGDNVRKLNEEAEEAFYFENYRKAIELFYKLDSLDPEGHSYYVYQIGLSYLYSNIDNYQALPNIEDSKMELEQGEMADVLYYHLGRAYHQDHQFDRAIENYKIAQELIADYDEKGLERELNRQIEICENAKLLTNNPVEADIREAGTAINSPWPDYKPVVTADESVMFFTSRKPGSTGDLEDETGRYYEDIYVSTRDMFGYWGFPNHISNNINGQFNEATIGLSADGTELYIYKGKKKGGDVYISKLNGTEWSIPEIAVGGVNTKGWEPSATVTADKKTMYFASNRKHGFGGLDIYVSTRKDDGTWSEAENLGLAINTAYDETTPYIHPDGKTLYFSSEGHNTMGGFDVFKVVKNGDTWSEPVNIGYPLNTTFDDFHFITTANGKRAYFSSARSEGLGEQDIYVAELAEKEIPVLLVRGNVITEGIGVGEANTRITMIDKTSHELVKTVYQPNAETGKYIILLPPAGEYDMIVEAEGFKPYQTTVVMPSVDEFHEVYQQIILKSLVNGQGQEIIVQNLFDDARGPINGDTSLTAHANKNNKDYIQLVTEALAQKVDNSGAKSINDIEGDNQAMINKLLEMTEPVAEAIKENQDNETLVAESSKSTEYVYNNGNPNKGLVPYEVDGRTVMVITDDYQETEAIAEATPQEEIADNTASQPTEESGNVNENTGNETINQTEEHAAALSFLIRFGYDKYVLEQKYLNDIEIIYSTYKRHKNAYIEVTGHTDSKGSEAYNTALSKRRAEIVAKYLKDKGVPKDHVRIKYVGEAEPISPNTNPDGSDNPEGRANNRRTEVKIVNH